MTDVQIPLSVPFMYGVILLFVLVLLAGCVRWAVRLLRSALDCKPLPAAAGGVASAACAVRNSLDAAGSALSDLRRFGTYCGDCGGA